jgi:hypothetical protein
MPCPEPIISEPLLAWLPDESLFSLVSRHHAWWGHTTPAQTTLRLFGHNRGGSQHDFPSRLGWFEKVTAGRLGDASRLAHERTLLKFYQPFLAPGEATHACEVMSGGDVRHLKLRIGILTSRFRCHHPLKACGACMAEDRDLHGWAYWHLSHQFPGVWTCPAHPELPLLASSTKVNGLQRFRWTLPREADLASPAIQAAADPTTCDSLARLTALIIRVVEGGTPSPLSPDLFRRAYRDALDGRGWLTRSGHLRLRDAAAAYVEHVHGLRTIPEFRSLPQQVEDAAGQLGRILRSPRGGTHPLRHLLMIHWLFGDLDGFASAVEAGSAPAQVRSDPSPADRGGGCRADPSACERAVSLVRAGGAARSVAATLGVDTKTVLGWATQAGLPVSRRPKLLTPGRRDRLVGMLRRGVSTQSSAKAVGVSVGTVQTVLSSDARLHAAWQEARLAERRTTARVAWLRETSNAGTGTKQARRQAPAAYAWLYRHDRDWLAEHTPTPTARASNPTRRSARDALDRELSERVAEAAARLGTVRRQGDIRRSQLCRTVDDLYPKLRALDQLPLTRMAVEQATTRTP